MARTDRNTVFCSWRAIPPAACCTLQRTGTSSVIEAAVASVDAGRISSAVLPTLGNGFRSRWALPPDQG
ncbi:hypothetical protein NDU88_007076 [Pleurodeles waltl]|uniref:Uncharacterized protein n=1 Tax=Pleurodeles waltl TaxID=8319 RepID=A0AAV7VSG7_PLEWA|nr:hypothetical protein NDU88_007076 [Pleurodeles waltl]